MEASRSPPPCLYLKWTTTMLSLINATIWKMGWCSIMRSSSKSRFELKSVLWRHSSNLCSQNSSLLKSSSKVESSLNLCPQNYSSCRSCSDVESHPKSKSELDEYAIRLCDYAWRLSNLCPLYKLASLRSRVCIYCECLAAHFSRLLSICFISRIDYACQLRYGVWTGFSASQSLDVVVHVLVMSSCGFPSLHLMV